MLCYSDGKGRVGEEMVRDHAAWACLCREVEELQGRWALGLEHAGGVLSGALSAQVRGTRRLANGHGALKLVLPPQPYITFPKFITCSYLSEIPQVRHLFQQKGGSTNAGKTSWYHCNAQVRRQI